ncbi:MAG: hypothetical protein HW390_1288 [Candidatus Brocadiaceae bacterium]|nr:hypothetical protein [Candidatus Brocadiaceae bacterium]
MYLFCNRFSDASDSLSLNSRTKGHKGYKVRRGTKDSGGRRCGLPFILCSHLCNPGVYRVGGEPLLSFDLIGRIEKA